MQTDAVLVATLWCIVGPPTDGALTRVFSETYNPRDNADAAFLIVGFDAERG